MRLTFALLAAAMLFFYSGAWAQLPVQPANPITAPATNRDTSKQENSKEWHDEPVRIYRNRAYSEKKEFLPDTSIHHFHRRKFLGTWYRNLGNLGTPAASQLFSPENLGQCGPSLGYHVYDEYRFDADSLLYYNTTRPYTSFGYELGSKLEQTLRLLHTQNITPRWNIALQYRKVNSAGYFRLQRSNHDLGALSTQFKSRNLRYELFGAIVYNKEQTDENGGILGDSLLSDGRYSDRGTLPVALDNPSYFNTSSQGQRSSVTNTLRDFNVLLQHRYTLGRRDTAYNADSTQYNIVLVPRFSIGHRLEAGSAKHRFKSLLPLQEDWHSFYPGSFASSDSVYSEQYQRWIDNRFTLSGFIGKGTKQVSLTAGIGNRFDDFYTDFVTGRDELSMVSTYLSGTLQKEALSAGAWSYHADAKLFISGAAAGDFTLNAALNKDFGPRLAVLSLGASQQLSEAPYAYTIYQNQYFAQRASLNKESITSFWGRLASPRLGLNLGIRSYVLSNYIFLADSAGDVSNGKLLLSQHAGSFSLTQITAQKQQHVGSFVLDGEAAFQALAGQAPLYVPALLARLSLSYES
ncbi:MAG: hypothetical protein JST06_04700, partial [Bacteroidetes bacterium]|nr:hypothetical protein [Bacteroidota bacterium]